MDDAPRSSGRSGEGEFGAHPLVAKLIEAIERDEGVVELRGFIGPAGEGDDPVPLYTTLELTERFLVPRDAIVHVEEPERDRRNEEPTRVYVKGSAELRLISCSITTIRADEASPTWSTYRVRRADARSLCGWQMTDCIQAAGGDFHRQIECFSNYVKCIDSLRRAG
jgi:hypothetical protein